MARSIKDVVVTKRCEETGFDTVYIDNVPIYAGYVEENLEKVKLNPSEFGLQKVAISNSLRDKYESIRVTDDECFIEIEGVGKFPATREQVRICKALLVEQLNRNEDYSEAVTVCFTTLLDAILTKKQNLVYEDLGNHTPMQVTVIESILNFIRMKLLMGGNNDVSTGNRITQK